jgi:hypothetical protein
MLTQALKNEAYSDTGRVPTEVINGDRQRVSASSSRAMVFSPRQLCAKGLWRFGTLPKELRMRRDVSDAAKVMYSALAEMEATMPEVRPGINRLASEVGASRSTAIRTLNELKKKHLIEVQKQKRKGRRAIESTNVYRFLLNPKFFPETFQVLFTSAEFDTSAEFETSVKNGAEPVPKMAPSWCQKRHPSKTIEKDHTAKKAGFHRFYSDYIRITGVAVNDVDERKAEQQWDKLTPEEQFGATEFLKQLNDGRPPGKHSRPQNYLADKPWTRKSYRELSPEPCGLKAGELE